MNKGTLGVISSEPQFKKRVMSDLPRFPSNIYPGYDEEDIVGLLFYFQIFFN